MDVRVLAFGKKSASCRRHHRSQAQELIHVLLAKSIPFAVMCRGRHSEIAACVRTGGRTRIQHLGNGRADRTKGCASRFDFLFDQAMPRNAPVSKLEYR